MGRSCRRLVAFASVAVIGLAMALPTSASADTELGGIDYDAYCKSRGFDNATLAGPANGPYAAYNWRCQTGTETYALDLSDACRFQHANPAAVATTTNPDDAYSWRCIVPSQVASDESCIPQPVLQELASGADPGALQAEPGDSDFGSTGPPSDSPSEEVSAPDPAADPCPWRGTFQDGYTLAGDRTMVDLISVTRKRDRAKVRFKLNESVPIELCINSLTKKKWQRCKVGGSTPGDHQLKIKGKRRRKVPRSVQLRFQDLSTGALQSYELAFKKRKGTITRSPVSIAETPPPPDLEVKAIDYPDGVGSWDYSRPFSNWIQHVIGKYWWIGFGFHTCMDIERYWFINYYKREQKHIRDHFNPGYNLGRPVSPLLIKATGFGWVNWRFYQVFDGGTWGRSSLTAPYSNFFGSSCSQKPHLITGVIFRKWSQIGHVNTIGGPLGGQYRSGPFIRQDFERGQIGFRDGNTGTVWYRYWGGPWRT